MAVDLKSETEMRLRQKVASGDFSSEDDVVRAGLDLLEDSEALQRAVAEGEAQIAAGEIVTASQSRTRSQELLDKFRRNA